MPPQKLENAPANNLTITQQMDQALNLAILILNCIIIHGFQFKNHSVTSAEVWARDSQPPTTNHIHFRAHVAYVCGHGTATLKHDVLACNVDNKGTCSGQVCGCV